MTLKHSTWSCQLFYNPLASVALISCIIQEILLDLETWLLKAADICFHHSVLSKLPNRKFKTWDTLELHTLDLWYEEILQMGCGKLHSSQTSSTLWITNKGTMLQKCLLSSYSWLLQIRFCGLHVRWLTLTHFDKLQTFLWQQMWLMDVRAKGKQNCPYQPSSSRSWESRSS